MTQAAPGSRPGVQFTFAGTFQPFPGMVLDAGLPLIETLDDGNAGARARQPSLSGRSTNRLDRLVEGFDP